MAEVPMVKTWRGKRIEDLTREEMLDLINLLGDLYFEAMEPAAIRCRTLGRLEMMKRGEPTPKFGTLVI
jgi:hypothetical protein